MWRNLLAIIYITVLGFSCTKPQKAAVSQFKGYVLDSLIELRARSDSSQAYVLYLPPNYTDDGSFPVIFAFDAHGNGRKIARWLVPMARRYGYVVAGSENFRNNVRNLNHILSTLQNDVFNRLKLNDERLYTAGFSGGGRIATAWAAADKRFRGAASLSAGLDMSLVNNQEFSVIIFAGKRDFNYNEIQLSGRLASNYGLPIQIIVFDGGHEYPPQSYSKFVGLWFEVNAMRQGLKPKDKRIVREVKSLVDSLLDHAQDVGQRAFALRLAVNYLQGLSSVGKYNRELDKILSSAEYKKYLAKQERIRQLESILQQEYLQALQQKDLDWWRNEIAQLDSHIEKAQDSDYKALYYRLKAYISIVCFSLLRDLIHSGHYDKAWEILQVYQMVDPSNPDVYFYKSALFAAEAKPDSALQAFEKAKTLGFADFQRLEQYPALKQILRKTQ